MSPLWGAASFEEDLELAEQGSGSVVGIRAAYPHRETRFIVAVVTEGCHPRMRFVLVHTDTCHVFKVDETGSIAGRQYTTLDSVTRGICMSSCRVDSVTHV